MMERVNRIIRNDKFIEFCAHTEDLEHDRIFCRHDMEHALDVARIAVIMAADEQLDIRRDVIYAAALLHDIGRAQQYINGTEHELASAVIAPYILDKCGYNEEEIDLIVEAIINHGNEAVKDQNDLTGILYRSDKASRKCYMCHAIDMCHKSPDKMVMEIKY